MLSHFYITLNHRSLHDYGTLTDCRERRNHCRRMNNGSEFAVKLLGYLSTGQIVAYTDHYGRFTIPMVLDRNR